MKTKILILIFCAFKTITCLSQKLEENKTDEFTKKTIKRTSWEKLIGSGGMSSTYTSYRISKLDDHYFLELKMMLNNKVYSINKGDKIMFLLEDGSVYEILNNEFALTCKGCGAPGYTGSAGIGTHTYYEIDEKFLEFLKKGFVKKIRVYTSSEYIEDTVNKGWTTKLIKTLALVGLL